MFDIQSGPWISTEGVWQCFLHVELRKYKFSY